MKTIFLLTIMFITGCTTITMQNSGADAAVTEQSNDDLKLKDL